MSEGGGRPAAGFLSEEWFEALGTNVRSAASRHAEAAAGHGLRLGVRVTGVEWAPGGQFSYTLVIGDDTELIVGSEETADVVLVGPYAAARALADGSRSVGELLEAGSIRVRGDVARLMAAGELLSLISTEKRGD